MQPGDVTFRGSEPEWALAQALLDCATHGVSERVELSPRAVANEHSEMLL